MTFTRFRLAGIAAGLVFVAACGGGGTAALGIESLGAVFQQAFAQGPNDAAIDVSNADLAPQLTQDPFEL